MNAGRLVLLVLRVIWSSHRKKANEQSQNETETQKYGE